MANLMIGGAQLVSASVGATPTERIYIGDAKVWPNVDITELTTKLVWVDSRAFYGGTQLTFGQHQAGDLLMVIAVGSVPPTAPYPYITAHQSDAAGTIGGTVAYQIAKAGGTSAGTWSGVAGATTYVIRGCHQKYTIGDVQSIYQAGSVAVSNAPALTLADPSGESLVVNAHYNNANTGSFNTGDPAGFVTKTKQDRMTSLMQLNSTQGLASALTHSSPQKTLGFAVEVLAGSYVPPVQPYLYDIQQTNKAGRVVDFVALKGFEPPDLTEEAFMFRCVQFPALDGYVMRTFSKTFPSSGYSKLDCTLTDQYGDGTPNPELLNKQISFSVTPTA